MRIGLVRHFKVKKGLPEKRILSAEELTQWFAEYDESEVEIVETDMRGIGWELCYTSDLTRAVQTADEIYAGEIVKTKDLREIAYPVFGEIWRGKLHFFLWAILGRISWHFRHKAYKESQRDVAQRLNSFLDELMDQKEKNILLVGHAALMMEMRKELLRRGFKGPKLGTPENGKLYVFEKG
ncbi:histidine phosphatase family protein [Ammoniphilus resinae]|uniref:Broad specificity phosphatase PhoE n=1 Tax=Ammoniphilus resinae TaxID=861532 RepID=A0ABS4GPB9_9BACL|nr:histidine phosphatase family protein [Ammoniphilus resinae]MBP1932091.1 broad specificity phosphatase PhoE [Ammoniphilus resinae]